MAVLRRMAIARGADRTRVHAAITSIDRLDGRGKNPRGRGPPGFIESGLVHLHFHLDMVLNRWLTEEEVRVGDVIAIDGKSLRGSAHGHRKRPVHLTCHLLRTGLLAYFVALCI